MKALDEHTAPAAEKSPVTNSPIYVFYHAECTDGFCAAWIAWKELGDEGVKYMPVKHGEPVPDVEPGATVFFLDFCPPVETIDALAQHAACVKVLDHHKTSFETLRELASLGWRRDGGRHFAGARKGRHSVTIEENVSGAMMALQEFDPLEGCFLVDHALKQIVAYVQDRDLWQWKLPHSRSVNAVIRSLPMTFEAWNWLEREWNVEELAARGSAILRSIEEQVKIMVERAWMENIGGHQVPVTCAPVHQSEVGEGLCRRFPEAPFSGSFYVWDGEMVYSLRSKGEFDVGALARELGGGGHRAAAGFRVKV